MKHYMHPEVAFGEWVEVETRDGDITAFPRDFFTPKKNLSVRDIIAAINLDVVDYHISFGWGARMNAPGYLDCTDWVVFESRSEAEDYLIEYFDAVFEE